MKDEDFYIRRQTNMANACTGITNYLHFFNTHVVIKVSATTHPMLFIFEGNQIFPSPPNDNRCQL